MFWEPDPRRGRFTISFMSIKHNPELVVMALQGLIIIRAEARFDRQHIEYVATGARFRELRPGEQIPDYDMLLMGNDHTEEFFCGFRERTKPNDVSTHPLIRPASPDGLQPQTVGIVGPGGGDGDKRGGSGVTQSGGHYIRGLPYGDGGTGGSGNAG